MKKYEKIKILPFYFRLFVNAKYWKQQKSKMNHTHIVFVRNLGFINEKIGECNLTRLLRNKFIYHITNAIFSVIQPDNSQGSITPSIDQQVFS